MDNDIALAIRLQANDRGIYDETLLNFLCQEHQHVQTDDIDEILEETFYLTTKPQLNITSTQNTYITIIKQLFEETHVTDYELINTNIQQSLTINYNAQHPQQPQQNPQQQLLTNIFGFQFGQQMPILTFNPGNPLNQINTLLNTLNTGTFNFNERVPVALTTTALNGLQDLTYDDVLSKLPNLDPTDQCSICFAKLSEKTSDKYNILPCEHVFHSTCIKPYLAEYDYHCPVCREPCGDHEAKIEM
jgi:hypothetical protein